MGNLCCGGNKDDSKLFRSKSFVAHTYTTEIYEYGPTEVHVRPVVPVTTIIYYEKNDLENIKDQAPVDADAPNDNTSSKSKGLSELEEDESTNTDSDDL